MQGSKILVFATKGTSSNEEKRIIELLQNFDLRIVAFSPNQKFHSRYIDLWRIENSCV
jgi:hypothetical protein